MPSLLRLVVLPLLLVATPALRRALRVVKEEGRPALVDVLTRM